MKENMKDVFSELFKSIYAQPIIKMDVGNDGKVGECGCESECEVKNGIWTRYEYDIDEDKENWNLTINMVGTEKNNMKICIENDEMVQLLKIELVNGDYKKVFRVPKYVLIDTIKSKYENGLLRITGKIKPNDMKYINIE